MSIDRSLAAEARLALLQVRPPSGRSEDEENIEPYGEKEAPTKSVILGELLAIFPGLFWHGLGHQYAGDIQTAREIRHVGEWGYLLIPLGGGMALGGYFVDQGDSQWQPYAISLYAAGGLTGAVGVGFFLTAWFYDMIDTPRAVKSGGSRPRTPSFTRTWRSSTRTGDAARRPRRRGRRHGAQRRPIVGDPGHR